jgi:hypothetical protein
VVLWERRRAHHVDCRSQKGDGNHAREHLRIPQGVGGTLLALWAWSAVGPPGRGLPPVRASHIAIGCTLSESKRHASEVEFCGGRGSKSENASVARAARYPRSGVAVSNFFQLAAGVMGGL